MKQVWILLVLASVVFIMSISGGGGVRSIDKISLEGRPRVVYSGPFGRAISALEIP